MELLPKPRVTPKRLIREFFWARLRWAANGGPGAVCGWASLAAGAIVSLIAVCWPNWAKQHVSERISLLVQGVIPVAAGASVLLIRWIISPFFVYKRLKYEIATKEELLSDRAKRRELLANLGRKLDVVQKMVRVCNDTESQPPTENVRNWELDTCIYLREHLGEAAESCFTSEVGVPPAPECRFTENRSDLLRTLHYRSHQLQKIFDSIISNPDAFQ